MNLPAGRVKTILEGVLQKERIPHAFLFIGSDAASAFETAGQFAESLSCSGVDRVVIEKQGSGVRIDQIRELKEWTRYMPVKAPRKIAIVKEAGTLTIEAANSFLKLLEEPPSPTTFILIAPHRESVLSTIASRCFAVYFPESPVPSTNYELRITNYVPDCLALAKKMSQDKETLPEQLWQMFLEYRKRWDTQAMRWILEARRALDQRANPRLTLDVLFLRLGHFYER